jgi:hypothetical protein
MASQPPQVFCTRCYTVAVPRKITAGSTFIELFFWLLFILPGMLYHVWRHDNATYTCSSCGGRKFISPGSPRARLIAKALGVSDPPPAAFL